MEDMSKLTATGLKRICRNEGIKGYSKIKKNELIVLVQAHRLDAMITLGVEELMAC